uniref:Uncharacterized protein n=1 Tax=Tanacetum cinerariifolium TaxID=118510 RepID=A0A699HRL2_TANCI|nr:hypothetical protein [Tanacetum cinerariifolium]
MAMRTQPTLSLGISARVTEVMALSPSSFRKRYIYYYETPSLLASPASSPTLPIWKRYQGISKPILVTETEGNESEAEGIRSESKESEEEGPGSEGEEVTRRRVQELVEDPMPSTFEVGQSSRSVPDQQVADKTHMLPARPTWVDLEDGTIYIDIKLDAPLVRALIQTPTSPEWSSSSLPISPTSLTVPSPVASPVTTLAATITVKEDEFIEVGAQLEFHGSILHDHTQRLDTLPPTLLKGMGRDIIELYDRSTAVKGEIHSQRFRLWILKRGQEQATITFGALWQPVLALEAFGRTDRCT